jgi:hypothetical protein
VIYYEGELFLTFGDLEHENMVQYCPLKPDELEELKRGDAMLEVDVFSTTDKKYKIFTNGDLRSDRI